MNATMPETGEIMDVVSAMFKVYLDQNALDVYPKECATYDTQKALTVLGWDHNRAYAAVSWIALDGH